jgi:hypothetical protein
MVVKRQPIKSCVMYQAVFFTFDDVRKDLRGKKKKRLFAQEWRWRACAKSRFQKSARPNGAGFGPGRVKLSPAHTGLLGCRS